MTALEQHVENYLAVRRGLGFKLTHEQRMLNHFVAFMDGAGESTLTVDLALRWATMPTGVGHAYLAQRMRAVRGFARNEDFPTPSWSPDGTRVTFVRGESDRSLLSVVNADGTGVKTLRRISLDTNEGGLPRWSPDGRRIAYVDAWTRRFQVFTIRPDGHGRRRVGDRSCGLDPVWRPDGRRLACVGIARLGARPRFAVNIVGLGGRIRRSLPAGGSRAALAAPTWSPDATRLTYLRRRRNGAALHVVDADGRHDRLLSARPSALSGVPATWSPDSSQIAYGTPQRSD